MFSPAWKRGQSVSKIFPSSPNVNFWSGEYRVNSNSTWPALQIQFPEPIILKIVLSMGMQF
jgi:hypothetical protein